MSLVSLGITVFIQFCPQAQISKTLTPGDLENEVATPKNWSEKLQYIILVRPSLFYKLDDEA